MAKRAFLVIGLLILLLVATGCPKDEETTGPAGRAFVGGTQGLVISFLSGLPPTNVFDSDNPFQIGLKIENKGEQDIEAAQDITITITGINPADFGVSSSDLTATSPEPLQGTSIDSEGNTIEGHFTTFEFPEMEYIDEVSGSVPFTIRANACYEYGTRSQGKLCVRRDLRGVLGEAGICDPNRQVPAENSGAPVQIINFKQNVAGTNKIDFFFTIQKTGSTQDTLHKKGTQCGSAIADRDIVWVDVSDTGLGPLKCTGLRDGTDTTGFVTLFSDTREIRCSQTLTKLDDFEKVIDIELTYSYKQFIDQTLNVKHVTS